MERIRRTERGSVRVSKTAQQKRSAWDKGHKDALNGRGYMWKKRLFKGDYDDGFQAGKYDRRWNAMSPEQRVEENKRANARRIELGPEPV